MKKDGSLQHYVTLTPGFYKRWRIQTNEAGRAGFQSGGRSFLVVL